MKRIFVLAMLVAAFASCGTPQPTTGTTDEGTNTTGTTGSGTSETGTTGSGTTGSGTTSDTSTMRTDTSGMRRDSIPQ